MSVNKVTLIGNLGKDPELKYTPSGAAVCNFSIALSEKYKDKDGVQQEKTEWVNIVAWTKLAEICGKYLQKGKQVYIEGRLQTRNYDNKEGQKVYITEVVANNMQMLGSKEAGANGSGNGAQGGDKGQGGGVYGKDQCSGEVNCQCETCAIPF